MKLERIEPNICQVKPKRTNKPPMSFLYFIVLFYSEYYVEGHKFIKISEKPLWALQDLNL